MNENLKTRILQSFRSRKFHMFAAFLILSFIFLVLTKFSKTYNERITLDLEYKNLPKDIAITTNESKTIGVEISTVGFRILAYYFKNRTISLDMERDVILGDSAYIYLPTINDRAIKDRIGHAVEILSIRPDTVLIPYSVLDTKRIPIIIDSDVTLASGYDYIDSLKVVPDSVDIIAPSSILANISSVSTEKIAHDDLQSSITEKVMLIKPEYNKLKLSEPSTQLVIDIAKFTEGTVQVPITIINLPKNVKINYFPKTVPVSFYVNLAEFGAVREEDFEVVCDYNQVRNSNNSFFLPTLVSIPEMVRSARIKQEKIEFITTK